MREWWGIWGISGKFVGINYALLPNCEWNQKHKKQPWSNVECFAFGVGIVRFASLETSFHAANHTIPTPPSYEGPLHCPKDKNRSPFHGEKPLVIKRILGRRLHQISQTISHGRDAILRVRDKLLISNMILQLWAGVKYHVPTGFDFSPKASGFYPFDDATALAGESGVGDVAWLIQASASNHKPKGRFFWYAFGIYKPKEPSLWFACHMSPTPHL